MSGVNGFINSHTLSQCNDSISLNGMDGDIENGDVSDGHVSMNRHTLYQNSCLKPLINLNISDDIYMNSDANNGDVSHEIGLIKNQSLSQFNE